MTTAIIRDVLIEKRLVAIECGMCHIDFGLGERFHNQLLADHSKWFFCPNGHQVHYVGPSGAEQRATKAEAERDAARSLAERESRRRKWAEDAAKHAEYQRRAAKGQLTKIRKRIANGVCPCCNRTFANLAEHMAGQHPDFVLPEGVDVP